MRVNFAPVSISICRSQRPRGLRRESAAARLLGLWVRIPPGGAWMSVSYECRVLSRRGLYVVLITRPEESHRVWSVQWVWSRDPVRKGHDLESCRSVTGKKTSNTMAWWRNIRNGGKTPTVPYLITTLRSLEGHKEIIQLFKSQEGAHVA